MSSSGSRGGLLAVVAVAVVIAAGVLAGCASRPATHRDPAGGAAVAATTSVRSFHAYDSTGALAVAVRDVAQGQCWTTSIAAPSPDAYRCLAGNRILDPCFASPKSARELACLSSPWSDAVVLRVTKALPRAGGAPTTHRPWAIVLSNGARCVAATGTVPSVRGTNLGYLCPGGWAAALASPTAALTAADYGDPATNTLRTVTVSTIWRG